MTAKKKTVIGYVLASLAIIAAAALVYGVLLLALRAIERADVLLLPHGAKIADILHLK